MVPAAGSSGRRAQSPLKSSLRYTVAVEAAATTDSIWDVARLDRVGKQRTK